MDGIDVRVAFAGLFEFEVFVRLILLQCGHPLANDDEFVNDLIEKTCEAIQYAATGEQLIVGIRGTDTSLVAAIAYCEQVALESGEENRVYPERVECSVRIRKMFPSCFVDSDGLI